MSHQEFIRNPDPAGQRIPDAIPSLPEREGGIQEKPQEFLTANGNSRQEQERKKESMEQHKAKLATDPRFAGWVARSAA